MKKILLSLFLSIILMSTVYAWEPSGPVKVILPFGPGTGTEYVFRQVAKSSTNSNLFVVEYHPGDNGRLAWDYFAEQKNDGQTIIVHAAESALIVLPIISKNQVRTNPNDAIPVAVLATAPTMVAVPKDSSLNSVDDLIFAYRSQKKLNIGTVGGVETILHNSIINYVNNNTSNVQLITYKTGKQELTDVSNGNLDIGICLESTARPFIDAGKIKLIAAASNKSYKGIQSINSRIPGIITGTTVTIFLPNNTPTEIVEWYRTHLSKALESSEVQSNLPTQGWTVAKNTNSTYVKKYIESIKRTLQTEAEKVLTPQ